MAEGMSRVAAAVAAGLLVGGCASSTSTRPGSAGTQPANTSTQREAISRALVAADGRHVVVPYTGGGCVRAATLAADETAGKVTLVLRQIVSGSICPADMYIGTASVTLHRPLWGRELADGTTGRSIPYVDGRKLLRVTYVPPGYRFSAYLPFPGPPSRFTGWEREFTVSGQASAPVDIEQVPGNVSPVPAWPVMSRARVGGHLAAVGVLASNGRVYGREVSWEAGGYSFTVYTVMVRVGQHLPSVAELTGIAAGLRP